MHTRLFIGSLALLVFLPGIWGLRNLPEERWQILASLPKTRTPEGWVATNLTFYGLFSATAYTLATALCLLLLAACSVPPSTALLALLPLLGLGIPASRRVARWVEGKSHTFTVGGATFCGILLAPWVLLLANGILARLARAPIPPLSALAALSIALSFGEGLGRLACLSFGCCYGRPIRSLPCFLQRLMAPIAVTYKGETRKIAYAGGPSGEPVVPVPFLTLLVACSCGLAGTGLFLSGKMASALLVSLGIPQIWRVLSEFLRADFRGGAAFTPYQWMALLGMVHAIIFAHLLSDPAPLVPDLAAGLASLWQPGVLLLLEGLWMITFLFTGKSEVTAAHLAITVRTDRI